MITDRSSGSDKRMTFEKVAIAPTDLNADVNMPHFKPQTFVAIDHLKEVSHKCPHVDSIFDFITKVTASNITKNA